MGLWGRLTILSVVALMLGCSSLRKISRTEVRSPGSEEKIMAEPPPLSELRRNLIGINPSEYRGCDTKIFPLLEHLAQARLRPPSCPKLFEAHVKDVKEADLLDANQEAILESLVKSDCSGTSLTAPLEIGISVTQVLSQLINTNEEDASVRVTLRDDIQQIMSKHIPIERRIQQSGGDYVLTEGHLELINKVISSNCKPSGIDSYFSSHDQSFSSLEETEAWISDDETKAKFTQLRQLLSALYSQKIKGYFR